MTIGERIKRLRKQANMSQEELANKLNTTKQAIYKYETGLVTNIPMEKIEIISGIFHITPSQLMGWENGIIERSEENNRLSSLRHKCRKSDADFASLIGMSLDAYRNYEKSNFVKKDSFLEIIAKKYNVSIDYLIGKPYCTTIPFQDWAQDYREDYFTVDDDIKKWLELMCGKPVFKDKKVITLDALGIRSVSKKRFPMLGEIACGKPIFANEEHESYIDASANIDADFCLTARGDSMIGAGVKDGDVVFIKSDALVNDGDIAAIIIEDTATLKRVYYLREQNKLTLVSENPRYAPLVYEKEQLDTINILGKAICYMSKL